MSQQRVVQVVANYHNLERSDVYPVLPQHAGRVLDLGGGVGATAAALKMSGQATYAVVADQVDHQVAEGIDRAHCGNLEDAEFLERILSESGPFDTILALDVLEHLRDPWTVVRILHNGLVPNGVIVASIPNVNYYGLVLPLMLKGRYELTESGILDRTHIRWFARHGAVELMSCSGLKVETVVPNIGGRKKRLINKACVGGLTRFLALQYVIRAKRVV